MTKDEKRELDRELITGLLGVASNYFELTPSNKYWISEPAKAGRLFSPCERVQDAFECVDRLDYICRNSALTLELSLSNIKSALGAYHMLIRIVPDGDDDSALVVAGDAEESTEAIALACREAYRAIKKEGE